MALELIEKSFKKQPIMNLRNLKKNPFKVLNPHLRRKKRLLLVLPSINNNSNMKKERLILMNLRVIQIVAATALIMRTQRRSNLIQILIITNMNQRLNKADFHRKL
jgi:hypothetical protein